ncbi:ABC transporter substrate-binding protein [Desmospora profundinema]|uniref:Iron complex transport system substrate-binding protein n=1 Tax=Desmospora profundinema TaxID=1571184 RepID=A0ABU1IMB0_9BACL|nr:ABC transporter substrate-binding protein [Desmospora profundinema]MDR6225913.1 iron complex transport system substrate-binding protein [Desmospora profundinema]
MKIGSRLWVLMLVLVMVWSVGCQAVTDTGKEAGQPQEQAGESFPVTLTDGTDTEVTIESEPKAIVSLIPSMTETAYALDLGDKMVGVTTNDDYPEEVKELETVGDMTIDVEKVASLKPDLVLASTMNGEAINKLRDLGLTVLSYEPQNLEDVFQMIRDVGQATGSVEKAEEVVSGMEEEKKQAQEVAAAVKDDDRARVWMEVSPELHTSGKGTFMDELITLAGGENVATDHEGWDPVSSETVVQWNPDVILFTHGDEKAIQSRGGWKKVNALKEGRIEALEGNLVSRPGPRITQGLLHLAEVLYPEAYSDVVGQ